MPQILSSRREHRRQLGCRVTDDDEAGKEGGVDRGWCAVDNLFLHSLDMVNGSSGAR
jgi:hypothetical protein